MRLKHQSDLLHQSFTSVGYKSAYSEKKGMHARFICDTMISRDEIDKGKNNQQKMLHEISTLGATSVAEVDPA
jgi:hypothetical protein